jgi:hypothetical protein
MLKATRRRALGLGLVTATATVLSACGGGGGLLGGGGGISNPFSKGTSDFDMTFLSASSTWDMNKDGTVTCDEWKQYAGEIFRDADGDKDGALTVSEWSGMVAVDKLFVSAGHDYYDANKDGKVTLEELTGRRNHAFVLLDKNNDCQLGHDEKANVYSVAKPKEKEVDQANPGGMGR